MHRALCGVLVAGFVLVASGLASAQVSPANEGKTAEQVYKNIKALQGTPANELNQSMHLMKGAVGLDCTYCHIEREWEKDVKPAKDVARKMIVMMNDINTRQFGGRQVVTCNTCHNGRPIPAALPAFPVAEPSVAAKPALPAVDQILAKYVEALGGEQALRKVTGRVITGTQYIPTGPGGTTPTPAAVERYQKAPNLAVTIFRRRPTRSRRVRRHDGLVAESGRPGHEPVKLDIGRAARGGFASFESETAYAQITVRGIETVNGRDAYLVVGVPQGDKRIVISTRRRPAAAKADGAADADRRQPVPDGFRGLPRHRQRREGPFVIHMDPANPRTELAPGCDARITKVEDNTAIDSAKFVKPASR